jgi:hypothetical protein
MSSPVVVVVIEEWRWGSQEPTDDEDEAVPPSFDGEEGSRAMSI